MFILLKGTAIEMSREKCKIGLKKQADRMLKNIEKKLTPVSVGGMKTLVQNMERWTNSLSEINFK